MESKTRTPIAFSVYSIIFAIYLFIGVIAAHPYDDAIYAQHAQFFYYLSVNPVFSLPMGIYYDFINIGGYFVTILFSLLGVSNVLTVQIGVKTSFIVFTFLTSYFLYKIVKDMGLSGYYASLLLLTSPMYIFTSVIYGSAIIVSVFFLVSSVYFLFRHKTLSSAILFGMAAGTYVYPIFSMPFLIRYLYLREGKRAALAYLFVSSAFAALGQLSVLFVYAKLGFATVAPTTPGGYLAAFQLPYYSIFDIFKITGNSVFIPGVVYNYLYYISSIFASFTYFLLKKDKVNRETLLVFFLIQGVLFSSLNPYNLPSYLVAAIPFVLLIAFIKRRWVLIGMLWTSSILSLIVLQTINSVGFLIYFSDVNTKLLNISNSYPSWLNSVAGFLYSLSLLSFIAVVFKVRPGNRFRPNKSLISQLSVSCVFAVVAIIVLASSSGVPSNMLLENKVNVFQAQPISESLSGSSLIVEYNIQLAGFLNKNSVNDFVGNIEIPSSAYILYNTSKQVVISPGNFSDSLMLDFPTYGNVLELFGTGSGSVSVELVNETNSVLPSSSNSTSSKYMNYSYTFNTLLSGSYRLYVKSDVPLYGSNGSSPSIYMHGFPDVGNLIIGRYTITGNYIPGYLLKSSLLIKFTGPFNRIPPFEPSLSVYLGKTLTTVGIDQLFEGGMMFFSFIVFPPSVAMYQITKKELRSKKSKHS